jgi:hypothetical protein
MFQNAVQACVLAIKDFQNGVLTSSDKKTPLQYYHLKAILTYVYTGA